MFGNFPDHELVLKSIYRGEPQWELICNHTNSEWGIEDAKGECWLYSWWEGVGVELVDINGPLLCVPVAPEGWTEDVPGRLERYYGPECDTNIYFWDEESCPTCTHPDPRVAALEMLRNFYPIGWFRRNEAHLDKGDRIFRDPLAASGFCHEYTNFVTDIYHNKANMARFNTLHAWIVAHLKWHFICYTCREEGYDDYSLSGGCQAGEDAAHGELTGAWALEAKPEDFIRFAAPILSERVL